MNELALRQTTPGLGSCCRGSAGCSSQRARAALARATCLCARTSLRRAGWSVDHGGGIRWSRFHWELWRRAARAFFDWALRFLCDFVGSLPTVFVAAVFWAGTSSTLRFVCALGLLRGLEQAWLLRCEIVRLEAEDPESVPHGLGRTPLVAFLRRRMSAALGPLFVSASFSVAWLTALDAAVTQAGLRPPHAQPDLGPLARRAAAKPIARAARRELGGLADRARCMPSFAPRTRRSCA